MEHIETNRENLISMVITMHFSVLYYFVVNDAGHCRTGAIPYPYSKLLPRCTRLHSWYFNSVCTAEFIYDTTVVNCCPLTGS